MDMNEQYELKMDLNLIHHLGINLYSNVPAVLAELVANSWDADATRVDIFITGEGNKKRITLKDNGCGMDEDDLQEKFLTVGYRRRNDESNDKTPIKKRLVMGRKGIGKLSVFSIAGSVQVATKKKGLDPLAIQLDIKDIEEKIDNEGTYHPQAIEVPGDIQFEESGTVIILEDLKKRINVSLDTNLRRRVARRFSVIGKDFQVFINNKEVTWNDMFSFENLDCILVYDDIGEKKTKPLLDLQEEGKELRVDPRGNSFGEPQNQYHIRGWIGIAKTSTLLQEDDSDHLNKISILTRGKMACEDILSSFGVGGMYTKYVIGNLEADFLDVTDGEDIATSNRQDFVQYDARFTELTDFIGKELRYLGKKWDTIKETRAKDEVFNIPELSEWFDTFQKDDKEKALEIFGRFNKTTNDETSKKEKMRGGVLLVQRYQHNGKIDELNQLDSSDLNGALRLSSDVDDMEASWYYQITKGRLDVIKKLADLVEENVFEKVLQEHICKHLWLLDPSWDRATETPTLERSVRLAFNEVKKNDEEKKGRIDITYKKTSGKHVIIELKRPSVKIAHTLSLVTQVDRYRAALRKELKKAEEDGSVETVCLLGEEPSDWKEKDTREESEKTLDARNIRIVTYNKLIKDAERSYEEYLVKNKSKEKIEEVFTGIKNAKFTTDS